MNSLLYIAAVLGVLTAPAIAGNGKSKNRPVTKPTTLVADKATLAVEPANAAKPAAAPTEAVPAGQLDIPALPPDTSSPLQAYGELERLPIAIAKPAKPTKQKPALMNMGASYGLGGRQCAKPEREVEQIIPKSLNQAQVASVIQSHMSEIQNCWDLVPKAHRADACTAQLKLSISDAGVVTNIELGGDVPAGAHKCITSAVARWTFPVAETRSDVEYGISLRSL